MRKGRTLLIGSRRVGDGEPVFVVAEAGVNHNGSVKLAKKLVDIAKSAHADAVKFQTWNVNALYAADEVTGKPYRASSRKRCLSHDEFRTIQKYCKKKGVLFLSTPDEEESADFLASLRVPAFKIGSGELTNIPLLEHIAKKGKPTILSTGMGSDREVLKAVKAITRYNKKLILLHAISSYPTLPEEVTIRRVKDLRKRYGVLTGFSDHTLGNTAAILAVGEGAVVIEKHFTFDKKASGPDHHMSLDPKELAHFVQAIREATLMYSKTERTVSAAEKKTKAFAWKSAVARKDIKAGERFSLSNVVFKRPGTGITVDRFETLRGKKARRAISEGHFIRNEDSGSV